MARSMQLSSGSYPPTSRIRTINRRMTASHARSRYSLNGSVSVMLISNSEGADEGTEPNADSGRYQIRLSASVLKPRRSAPTEFVD